MGSYLYVGDDERYFPSLNLTAYPGEVYEFDENPDPPHFDEVTPGGENVSQSVAPIPDLQSDTPAEEA